jgi:hydroxylamine reductase (hybrid-cluster protein)
MNKFILSVILGLSIIGTGCNTIKSNGQPTEIQLKQDAADMETSARIATRVYILTIDNSTDRAKTEQFAHNLADQITKDINTDSITLEQLKDYASGLINGSNLKHKQAVGLLLDSVSIVIEEKVNTQLFNLQGDARSQAIKTLIKSACEGIMEATSSLPTTQP